MGATPPAYISNTLHTTIDYIRKGILDTAEDESVIKDFIDYQTNSYSRIQVKLRIELIIEGNQVIKHQK